MSGFRTAKQGSLLLSRLASLFHFQCSWLSSCMDCFRCCVFSLMLFRLKLGTCVLECQRLSVERHKIAEADAGVIHDVPGGKPEVD